MKTRVAAMIVLFAGLAAVAWVAVGGNDNEAAIEKLSTTAPSTTSESDAVQPAPEPTAGPTESDPSDSDPAESDPAESDTATVQTPAEAPEPAEEDVDLEPTATADPGIDAPQNFGPRMDLVDIDGWLNTDATSIDEFNGQVLLVEMWTFGCHNCKARIPFNQSYYEEFADENFEILGVHAPEFSYEADVSNIVAAAEDLGVVWPIALDPEKLNFRAWQPGTTSYWPRTYVIDQNGDIRYDHIGEGKYEELRETIRYLIENPPAPNSAS